MKVSEKQEKFECTFSEDELIMIKNSLGEVCFGMNVYEFHTRLGYSRDQVSVFAKLFSNKLRDLGVEE